MRYVALLRGINVGGKNKVPMGDLKSCLEKLGLKNVRTYIQSGNVVFETENSDEVKLTADIENKIEKTFGFPVVVALFSQAEFEYIAAHAPSGWLNNPEWKYNYLFLKKPTTGQEAVAALGDQKSDIELAVAGQGVVYQAMSIKAFGRTTASKMIGTPIYKQMTIRNDNTVQKILSLLRTES
jgi:uncharacterized protein (DUF1697 family)